MVARRGAAPAALVLALLAAACAPTAPGSVPAGAAASAAPGAAAEGGPGRPLVWGSCTPYALDAADTQLYTDPRYECAMLSVPRDHGVADGTTVEVAVMRRRALGPDPAGSLVLNPGGPGVSGLAQLVRLFAPAIGDGELARRFDLVAFDPRGVGSSRPAVDCLTDAEREAQRREPFVDSSAAGVVAAEANAREFARRCAERVGVDVLATVGTRDVVRDLEVLRAALGDSRLTYAGFSYGTRIGSAYAEAFPGNVRAMLLDGALDPEQSGTDRAVAQRAGFQAAFDAYARWCAGQPECPVGRDPAAASDEFQELLRPLLVEPARTRVGRPLSYADAVAGVKQALYLEQLREPLSFALHALASGDGTVLMQLADAYEERRPDGRYGDTLEAFTAVQCVDEARVEDRGAALEVSRRMLEAAPFLDAGTGPSAARDPCAFWPVPTTGAARRPDAPGLPPLLVVSTTGDPATPHRAGVDLAEALGARLLTVEGASHTAAFSGSDCVDRTVVDYLVDPASPLQATRCPAA